MSFWQRLVLSNMSVRVNPAGRIPTECPLFQGAGSTNQRKNHLPKPIIFHGDLSPRKQHDASPIPRNPNKKYQKDSKSHVSGDPDPARSQLNQLTK